MMGKGIVPGSGEEGERAESAEVRENADPASPPREAGGLVEEDSCERYEVREPPFSERIVAIALEGIN